MSGGAAGSGLSREPVTGGGVRLRPYRAADAGDIVTGCSDPETRRFIPDLPEPYTLADAEWWITTGSAAVWAAGGAAYAIADPVTDRLLGGIGIDRVVPLRRQAEVGYWVTATARGRGVATAAVVALAEHVLGRDFDRLELLTEMTNVASQRVALAAGFQREGIRRGAGRRTGTVRPASRVDAQAVGAQAVDAQAVGQRPEAGDRGDLVAWVRLVGDPPGPTPRLLPDLPNGQLTDGVIRLRPKDAADTEVIHELWSLPEVVAASVPPVPPALTEVSRRCAEAPGKWLAGERADLVIVDAASGAPAGSIGLFYQEPQTQQAMVGYSMLPRWRGRGYPTRAVRLLADWAFRSVGIARLIAGTRPDNAGSQRVLTKAGFRREGYQRSRLPGPDGGRVDDVLFALLPEDLDGIAAGREGAIAGGQEGA